MFWELRQQTSSGKGIFLPFDMDPVVRRLLKACDSAYLSDYIKRMSKSTK